MVASAYCASGLPASAASLEQIGGVFEVLIELLALQVQQAEIVIGRRVAELGGLRQQARAFVRIARAGAAFEGEHRQCEHRVAIAMAGGELVPLRRLGIVAADALAVGVKFAEQRHGGRIVLPRRAWSLR